MNILFQASALCFKAPRILVLLVLLFSTATKAAICQYEIVDEWNSGYKAEITILNDGESAINDWRLNWNQDAAHTIDNAWDSQLDCVQGSCVATPPSYFSQIGSNQSFKFGFVASKNGGSTNPNTSIEGTICSGDIQTNTATWSLDSDTSSISFVSIKKDHVAERISFTDQQEKSLTGSIDENGQALLSLSLENIDSGITLRDERLITLLFETELLPKVFVKANIDLTAIQNMSVGSIAMQTLPVELALHGVRQNIDAELLVVKKSDTDISVTSVKPLLLDSKSFDMDHGIELLRLVANLSSIGEMVPVYLRLNFEKLAEQQAIEHPEAVNAPSDLLATYDPIFMQANLAWFDNSDQESHYLVRRKSISGRWSTVAELEANSTELIEALPEEDEYDYKIIALNNGMPSLPSNIERISVTEGNQLVRGQQIYQNQCAACHGDQGQGLNGIPAINLERDLDGLIEYIETFMPLGSPDTCDRQCAEDVVTYIQTLWVAEIVCDVDATPVAYGARQLKILTQSEFQNSVEDLLGIDIDLTTSLSADSQLGFFANNTHASMTAAQYSNFLLAAQSAAQWSSERDFSPALSCSSIDSACASSLVTELAPQIFRRPLTADEISDFNDIALGSYSEGDIKAGMQLALEGMLSSPQFLYRHELGEVNPDNTDIDSDAFELTSYEMATFLAYTYTGSTPDQTLLAAAAEDKLRDTDEIIKQAQRLMEQSVPMMHQFVGSWLGTKDLGSSAKDELLAPNFSSLVEHMINELNQTFSYVMLNPAEQFSSLYTAEFSFLNQTLADHYGISGSFGSELQKVPTSDRGGILANGAFMARWGEAQETAPIIRSVRVRRRMLCQDQPDPPAGTFAAREQKLAELAEFLQEPTTTNRMKYHRLTEDTPCTNCHIQHINPLGFGMEDFDTLGRVRSNDLNGNLIDAAGELFAPDVYSNIDESIAFVGTRELGAVLASQPTAQGCLPKQMFRFVTGVGHQEIDTANPEGTALSDDEKAGYACAVDSLTDTLMDESPRAMFEKFGSLDAIRYRKAWSREVQNED
jgi:hypothetical protein